MEQLQLHNRYAKLQILKPFAQKQTNANLVTAF